MTNQGVEQRERSGARLAYAVDALTGVLLTAQSRSGVIDPVRVRWDRVVAEYPEHERNIEILKMAFEHVRDILGHDAPTYFSQLRDYSKHFEALPESHAKNCLTVLLIVQAGSEGVPLFNSRRLRAIADRMLPMLRISEDGSITEDNGESRPLDMRYLVRELLLVDAEFTA